MYTQRRVARALSVSLAAALVVGAGTLGASAAAADPVGLPYADDFSDGTAGWTPVGTSSTAVWSSGEEGSAGYVRVANLASGSGSYLRPVEALELPESYRLDLAVRLDDAAGSLSVLTDVLAPYAAGNGNKIGRAHV